MKKETKLKQILPNITKQLLSADYLSLGREEHMWQSQGLEHFLQSGWSVMQKCICMEWWSLWGYILDILYYIYAALSIMENMNMFVENTFSYVPTLGQSINQGNSELSSVDMIAFWGLSTLTVHGRKYEVDIRWKVKFILMHFDSNI